SPGCVTWAAAGAPKAMAIASVDAVNARLRLTVENPTTLPPLLQIAFERAIVPFPRKPAGASGPNSRTAIPQGSCSPIFSPALRRGNINNRTPLQYVCGAGGVIQL